MERFVLEKKDKETNNFMEVLREEAKTPICDWLDSQFGATVRDKKVFENLTRFWENEFNQDRIAAGWDVRRFAVYGSELRGAAGACTGIRRCSSDELLQLFFF